VKLEESSRALTPPGGFPAITPEVLAAADGAGSRYPLGQSDGSRRGLAFMEEEAS
jgi:hypothetical protein